MVVLSVGNDDGPLGTLQVPGPGGKVRFAVGAPGGPRSGVWLVFATKNTSDVYVAGQVLGRYQKISLHQSGQWLYQWRTDHIAQQYGAERRRLAEWPRPPALGAGWTRGFRILVPGQDVRPVPNDNLHKPVMWVPTPGPGKLIAFDVVVAQPDQGVVLFENPVAIQGFTLANGEVCLVVATEGDLGADQHGWLDEQRSRILASLGDRDLSGAASPRLMLFGFDGEGNRFIWDLAAATMGPRKPES